MTSIFELSELLKDLLKKNTERVVLWNEEKCKYCNVSKKHSVKIIHNTLRDPFAGKYRVIKNNVDMILVPTDKLSCLFLNNKNLFWQIGSFLEHEEFIERFRLCKYAYWINFGVLKNKDDNYKRGKRLLKDIKVPRFKKFPNCKPLKFINKFVKSDCSDLPPKVCSYIELSLQDFLKNTDYQNELSSYTSCGTQNCKSKIEIIIKKKFKEKITHMNIPNEYYEESKGS
jgi:hypothetical protein